MSVPTSFLDLTPDIRRTSELLLETLQDGVNAYREGESRATFANALQLAWARERYLKSMRFVDQRGRPTYRYASGMAGVCPSTAQLLEAARKAAEEIGRDRFVQMQDDTVTWQENIDRIILMLAIETGGDATTREPAFYPTRSDLRRRPPHYTTGGSC